MIKLTNVLAAIAISFVLACSAHAQLLSETFTYPDGSLVGATGSPWTTNSGTAGQQNVVSGELFLDDNETEDTIASLSSAMTSGTITATFNLRADPADISTATTGNYITHFVAADGTFVARLFTLSSPETVPTDDFRLGIATTSGSPTAVFPNSFTAGVNHSITLSYDFTTDLASLSVAGFGTIVATDVVDIASIDRYGFRQSTTHGDHFIDNLEIVPEPATSVLLGVGVLLGALRVRRRASK